MSFCAEEHASGAAVNDNRRETTEERITRYLNWAAEAMRSGAQARNSELRAAHLAIAGSWMRLAEQALEKLRPGRSAAATFP